MDELTNLWFREYQRSGIPSSYLHNPSGVMEILYKYLAENKISLASKTAADLGCGRGRNSISLVKHNIHKVYSIDFVPVVIEALEKTARELGFSNIIKPICHDLSHPWPMPSNSLDLIIDIFCFKHQIDPKKEELYKNEIERTLKKGGLMLLDLAAIDDGFYGNLDKTEVGPNVFKVIDPKTGVGSHIYTKESLLKEFPNFKLLKFLNDKKDGQMHGATYIRSTLKFLLRKN